MTYDEATALQTTDAVVEQNQTWYFGSLPSLGIIVVWGIQMREGRGRGSA